MEVDEEVDEDEDLMDVGDKPKRAEESDEDLEGLVTKDKLKKVLSLSLSESFLSSFSLTSYPFHDSPSRCCLFL